MKKRNLFTLMLVALLAFTLGMGTLAYYTKTFASNDNLVRAAKFTVDSGGTLDESMEFDLTGEPLMPGETRDLHEFEIHKNDTQVPVNYKVTVKGRDKLFKENSPVKLNLYKKTGEDWNLYDGAKFIATEKVEKFKIEAVWSHSDNDIAYQDATGKVSINVVATQADLVDPVDPVDPEDPVDAETAKVMIEDVNNALIGLDGISSGNFSKADSDAVQKLIDDVKEYVGLLPSSEEKTELLEEISEIQNSLTEKVNARYVYFETVESETNINQLKFDVSADFWTAGKITRLEQNKAIVISRASDGAVVVKYSPMGSDTWNIPAAGDKWETTLRFNKGVRTLRLILTNNGDGSWDIESDWLKANPGM